MAPAPAGPGSGPIHRIHSTPPYASLPHRPHTTPAGHHPILVLGYHTTPPPTHHHSISHRRRHLVRAIGHAPVNDRIGCCVHVCVCVCVCVSLSLWMCPCVDVWMCGWVCLVSTCMSPSCSALSLSLSLCLYVYMCVLCECVESVIECCLGPCVGCVEFGSGSGSGVASVCGGDGASSVERWIGCTG